MTDKMCKVSILVPVYNTSKYLRQCLDSVVGQSLSDIEIICINDGSIDESLDILKDYQYHDSRIRIIDKKNTGYGHSMNQGLRMAKGKYIGIVESDDFADVSMFEQLYDLAEREKVDIVKSNHWFHSESMKNGDQYYEMFEGCPYNEVISPIDNTMLFLKSTCVWTSLYRRDFLLTHDIWFNETPGASYQDVAFTLKTLSCSERIYLVKDAFLHYRIDNMQSSVNSREKVYCDCDEFAELWRYLDERPKIKAKVNKLIPPAMYRIYKWNLGRIARKFRLEFYERMVKELLALQKEKILDKRYFDDDIWNEVSQILESPMNEIFETRVRLQSQDLLEEGFVSCLAGRSSIYIYGAGIIANKLLRYLKNHNIKVKCMIVENVSGNPSKIENVDVCGVKDILPNNDEVVLLGVKKNTQHEVLAGLENLGWKNIVLLDEKLREAIEV